MAMKTSDISDAQVLGLISAFWADQIRGQPWAYKRLASLGFPEWVVNAKFDKLLRRGLIECGVSARTGWLTDKGRETLHTLTAKGVA